MKCKPTLCLKIAMALLILFLVLSVARYGYAQYLCDRIAQGYEIHTIIGDITTAPAWFNRLFVIMQVDRGVKIPLVEACYYRNIQAVETLLANGASPNFYIDGSVTPIEAAIQNGPAGPIDEDSLIILEMLIDAGADVNLHAGDMLPIDQMASKILPDSNIRESIFLLLLDNGAVEEPSKTEYLLHDVIRGGNVELAYKMINDYGFSACSVGYQGRTPLILAVYYGQYNAGASATEDMICMLLACGANKDTMDDLGNRAYDYAVEYGYENILDYLK